MEAEDVIQFDIAARTGQWTWQHFIHFFKCPNTEGSLSLFMCTNGWKRVSIFSTVETTVLLTDNIQHAERISDRCIDI